MKKIYSVWFLWKIMTKKHQYQQVHNIIIIRIKIKIIKLAPHSLATQNQNQNHKINPYTHLIWERERERNVGLQHFWCHHYQSHHSSWWWCNHGFVLWRFLILLYTHLLLINSFMLGTQFFQPQDLENKLHILLSLSFSF